MKRFNAFLRKLGMPLNIINILVGLLIGIAHVYIPFASLMGLSLGILMALSSSASMGISYYFTSASAGEKVSARKEVLVDNSKSTSFIVFAVPMILLNSAASFFGMYTGIMLLAAALAIPVAPVVLTAAAIGLGVVLALGTAINSWLQANYVWNSLKTKCPISAASRVSPTLKKDPTVSPATRPEASAKPALAVDHSLAACPSALFAKKIEDALGGEEKEIAALSCSHRRTRSIG